MKVLELLDDFQRKVSDHQFSHDEKVPGKRRDRISDSNVRPFFPMSETCEVDKEEREKILVEANAEAEEIVRSKEKGRMIIAEAQLSSKPFNESEIMRSRREAAELLNQARQEAAGIRMSSYHYSEDMLLDLQEVMIEDARCQ